tara:strand:- start:1381 stop:2844 length:1464 start_codon:yes stop_codon:yes gene_type:complete
MKEKEMRLPELFDSLTRETRTFDPVRPGEARIYTCGPTVYNYAHIGNLRAYVFADVLGRTLRASGLDLTHIINITDVGHLTDDADEGEDKLEKAAAGSSRSIWDIAEHYTRAFKADFTAIGNRSPHQWTTATDYVERMIAFISDIADKHAYELESGLYFDTSTVPAYGRLSGGCTDESHAHGRIETVEGKRNPADFALWRRSAPGESRQMEWDSPWGRGAPGWHIECSVMSSEALGFPFDIHTGGIDHREVHHANEIAQNQAHLGGGGTDAESTGALMWMHNNFLVDRTGKMSKSKGDFLRLATLTARGHHPRAYRLMILQAHYRSELEFTWDGLRAATTRLKRMVMQAGSLPAGGPANVEDQKISEMLERFENTMAADLNTPEAIVILEQVLSAKKTDAASRRTAVDRMDAMLGLGLMRLTREDLRIRPDGTEIEEAEIERLIAERHEARRNGDYAAGDAIRDRLGKEGVLVMDGDPLAWEWNIGS